MWALPCCLRACTPGPGTRQRRRRTAGSAKVLEGSSRRGIRQGQQLLEQARLELLGRLDRDEVAGALEPDQLHVRPLQPRRPLTQLELLRIEPCDGELRAPRTPWTYSSTGLRRSTPRRSTVCGKPPSSMRWSSRSWSGRWAGVAPGRTLRKLYGSRTRPTSGAAGSERTASAASSSQRASASARR